MIDLVQESPASLDNASQQVVYAISHDFHGPLRLIKSFLQLLEADLGDDLNPQAWGYLQRVTEAADSLHARLDAVTVLSRVSTRGEALQPCSVRDSAENAVAELDAVIKETGASVSIDGPAIAVLADQEQLKGVFVELVGNSVKFCDAPAQVNVAFRSEDGRNLISVTDSGPGFDAQDPDDAFKLFRRFHHARFPGSGAGLAIARRILERHATDARIESSAQGNTTVTFALAESTAGIEGTA